MEVRLRPASTGAAASGRPGPPPAAGSAPAPLLPQEETPAGGAPPRAACCARARGAFCRGQFNVVRRGPADTLPRLSRPRPPPVPRRPAPPPPRPASRARRRAGRVRRHPGGLRAPAAADAVRAGGVLADEVAVPAAARHAPLARARAGVALAVRVAPELLSGVLRRVHAAAQLPRAAQRPLHPLAARLAAGARAAHGLARGRAREPAAGRRAGPVLLGRGARVGRALPGPAPLGAPRRRPRPGGLPAADPAPLQERAKRHFK